LIEDGVLNTAQKNWQWKNLDSDWTFVTHYPQNTQNVPPHLLENPSITLKPTAFKNNLFDFGRELFGYVVIRSREKPTMIVGESEMEALDIKNKRLEQTLEMVKAQEGVWKSKVPLAFRYVFTDDKTLADISCEAVFAPSVYRGAFACSDTMLTKIWMNSAYTLRLCMHDFLLDGIKRDRLPWTGDLAMSMMVNSFTFGDPELVRRSLVALGRAGIAEKDINGIIDYSLWWIIAQDQFQLYYGDKEHLTKEWDRIKAALKVLSTRCDENGFLIAKKDNWLFIDWVNQDKWTALQILWWWAQNSSTQLAERMGDKEMATYWKNSAAQLKANLIKTAWDEKQQIWLSSARDTAKENTRHPNFLAVISGITAPPQYQGISKLLENDKIQPVGTPYMAGFEMMARAQLGNIDYTLQKIADYWGGMITKGATSFWEAYDPNQSGAKQYAYYGRPYAKSLCHAWSSGPAAVLPSQILGLKPLADGWQRFTINPNLGSLKWVNVTVPTKHGNITVDIEGQNMEIMIPKGTELEWKGQIFKGPRILQEKL
jgi:alpha-L-rhamnosidase